MRLILVRHGDAYAGLHGTIAGAKGCRGLTDLGREQAARLRDNLAQSGRVQADVLMASELPRAIETAQIIGPALAISDIPQDCDLCEVHTGEADGMDWMDYTAKYGPIDMVAEPERLFAPGGDSWTGFHQRVDRVMTRLAAKHAGQTVVAVCHAGVIAASLRIRLGFGHTADSARLLPMNTSLTEWEHDPDTGVWTLRYFNDARHLDTP